MSGDTLATDITVKNGETITIPYTTTANGTTVSAGGGGWGTTTTGGTWTSTGPWIVLDDIEPDMRDWPPNDIIDWYAKDLAKRCPA